jgi:predicted dienelactone hydrolase
MKRFAAILCLATSVLAGRAETNAIYKVADGPLAVETVERVVLRDAKREKDLPVFASFPKNGGPLPIIIFSHGGGGAGDAGLPIVRHWTSHGYVVLCPTHADSVKLRRAEGDRGANMADVVRRALTRKEDWENRPRDVSFLLDALDELEKRTPALKGRMDRARIGVGGHSFGAFTAQAVGGATLDIAGDGKPRSLADKRVKAVLLLSGQGKGQMGLHEHSWDGFKLPMMSITGSHDRGAQGQDPAWRKEPFDRSPPGGKYHVFIEGANHFSFSGHAAEGRGGGVLGRFRAGGGEKAIFDYTKSATIAFWDAHLKQDAKARAWLQSDALPAFSKHAVKLSRK